MLILTMLVFVHRCLIHVRVADIVINNTGGPPSGMAHMADLEDYKSAFFQHVLSAQTIAQVAVPEMKKNGFGIDL